MEATGAGAAHSGATCGSLSLFLNHLTFSSLRRATLVSHHNTSPLTSKWPHSAASLPSPPPPAPSPPPPLPLAGAAASAAPAARAAPAPAAASPAPTPAPAAAPAAAADAAEAPLRARGSVGSGGGAQPTRKSAPLGPEPAALYSPTSRLQQLSVMYTSLHGDRCARHMRARGRLPAARQAWPDRHATWRTSDLVTGRARVVSAQLVRPSPSVNPPVAAGRRAVLVLVLRNEPAPQGARGR
jgi:hypothetical protein